MKKKIAFELKAKAEECAKHFSNPDRDFNYSKETFAVLRIIPLSEFTAAVIFLKSSEKQATAFFYYVKASWRYFFPSDSHLIGMRLFPNYKFDCEKYNYSKNFKGDEE